MDNEIWVEFEIILFFMVDSQQLSFHLGHLGSQVNVVFIVNIALFRSGKIIKSKENVTSHQLNHSIFGLKHIRDLKN